MVLLWLVVAVAFALMEVATVAFFAAFISIAAFAAALTALLGGDIVVQAIVFAVVAVLGLLAVRPLAVSRFHIGRRARLVSGAPAMVGQTAVVVDPINGAHQPGHVLISGERWPAVSAEGAVIEEGRTVMVLELRQATLVVAPVT